MPAISVLMPVYNTEKYLHFAMESILNQTFSDFEFWIIEDGSTDRSRSLLNAFSDSRIRRIFHAQSNGLIASLNECIPLTAGKWIARMDSDDWADPMRFEKQVQWMQAHPETDVLASTIELIDEAGMRLPPSVLDRKTVDRVSIQNMLPKECCIAHPSVLIKREVLLQNPYHPKAMHGEDYELWLRLLRKGFVFDKLDLPLVHYRIHSQSMTAKVDSRIQTSFLRLFRIKTLFLWESFLEGNWKALQWKTLWSLVLLGKKTAIQVVKKLFWK